MSNIKNTRSPLFGHNMPSSTNGSTSSLKGLTDAKSFKDLAPESWGFKPYEGPVSKFPEIETHPSLA